MQASLHAKKFYIKNPSKKLKIGRMEDIVVFEWIWICCAYMLIGINSLCMFKKSIRYQFSSQGFS